MLLKIIYGNTPGCKKHCIFEAAVSRISGVITEQTI